MPSDNSIGQICIIGKNSMIAHTLHDIDQDNKICNIFTLKKIELEALRELESLQVPNYTNPDKGVEYF